MVKVATRIDLSSRDKIHQLVVAYQRMTVFANPDVCRFASLYSILLSMLDLLSLWPNGFQLT
jgi:hypothetical protein